MAYHCVRCGQIHCCCSGQPKITSPRGQRGDQGQIGLTGAQGAQGSQGLAGSGTQGAQGPQGDAGAQGAQGATGSGAQGSQGATGSQGPAGSQGSQGAQGLSGQAGQGVPTGGTTGELLAKASGTDYDTEWVGPPIVPPRSPARFERNLIAMYDFMQGTDATKLYDGAPQYYGGGFTFGNQGTLGAGGAAPTWVSTGLSFSGGQYVALPTGLLPRVKTVQFFGTFTGSGPYNVVISGDQSSDITWALEFSSALYGPSPMIWKGGVGVAGYAAWEAIPPGANGGSGAAWVQDGVSDMYYIHGTPVGRINTKSDTSTFGRGGELVIGSNPGNGGLTPYGGVLSGMLLFDVPLSADDIEENHAWLKQDFLARGGVAYANPATNRQLFVEGDSLSTDVGGTLTSWPVAIVPSLTHTWGITNRALGGNEIGSINRCLAHRSIDRYAPAALLNVLVPFAGTNDFFWNNPTAANVFEYLLDTVTQALAAGFTVVIPPMLSRVNLDNMKSSYNALIAGYSWPTGVTVIPASSMTTLTANGAYANVTWFSDGTHPTQAGMNLIAATVATVLNAMG